MRASDYPFFDARFLAFAHRGGSDMPGNVGRENSLHAFAAAVELGFTHLETDVHATRDGVLVAFHDDRLDRVTDARGVVADLDYADVAKARIGGIDPIPTLAELFEAFPATCFNIDIKAPQAIRPLARAINEARAHDRVCVGSFGIGRLRAFRELMGTQVATAVSVAGVAWSAFAPLLPRLLNSPGVAFELSVTHPIAGRDIRILTPRLIDAAHRLGKEVHVWTIDEPTQMTALIDEGVDGLMTDRPDILKPVLVDRGLWEGTR